MSHESHFVLYRKYRPALFDEVLGQEHVTSVLQNAIEKNSVAHAYLFSGSRGIGKTSVARIFAKALGTSENDLYEIDAASNRGIDEVRTIRDAVRVLPFESKYKVYIIDEVHMLTKDAFNALLKTLEEPPAHVIFILATTEAHKLLDTVISRCQTFAFKKPTEELTKKMLIDVAKKEGYELDKDAAGVLATLAEGSFRDAHGVLQKVIASVKGKKIKSEDVEATSGSPKITLVFDLAKSILEKNVSAGVALLKSSEAENMDTRLLLKFILRTLRIVMLMKLSPELKKFFEAEMSKEELARIAELQKVKFTGTFSDLLRELLKTYDEMTTSAVPELLFEIALAKIAGE
ncbi:MAG: DNA polymerase III subunit gamma/tau [Candidatus Paceibacterota bacterium]|jgi:DNA polymerase-3 subunit gamma/tau